MSIIRQPRRNGAFLASEASGHRSREVVTLAPGTYPSGSVLATDGGALGVYDLADDTATEAVVLIDAVTLATSTECAVIARDAEVKEGLIEGAPGTTIDDLRTALAASNIHIRASF